MSTELATGDDVPPLDDAAWQRTRPYARELLPVRMLTVGSGMLIRALPLALLDAANRAGAAAGQAVVVQSTGSATAQALRAQAGLYTVIERSGGAEQVLLVGSVKDAVYASEAWAELCALAQTPSLRSVVSNVTEAAFRIASGDAGAAKAHASGHAPSDFVGKLTALLHARWTALGDAAPVLVVIPTELVDDNGRRLQTMVRDLAAGFPQPDGFLPWLTSHVAFCGSLVDRITTGEPDAATRARLTASLRYADTLMTAAEPYAFWAIEGDPALLQEALPIAAASPDRVVFAHDITPFRERKLRLLNGAHTALAPLAVLLGHRTVDAAMREPAFAACVRQLMYHEIVPTLQSPEVEARAFADTTIARFANPTLGHQWTVILGNQALKLRNRVAPTLLAAMKAGRAPALLALAIAAWLERVRLLGNAESDPAIRALGAQLPSAMADPRALRELLTAELFGAGSASVDEPFAAAVWSAWAELRIIGVHGALEQALRRCGARLVDAA